MKIPKSLEKSLTQWSYVHKDASKNLIKLKQSADELNQVLKLKKKKKN